MTKKEKINFISGAIKVLEDNMFPVLTRTEGKSLHHQLNRVEVFPGYNIPNVHSVGMIKKEDILTSIKVVEKRDLVVVDEKEHLVVDLPLVGSKSITIEIPTYLWEQDNMETMCDIIYNTFIYNIRMVLNESSNEYDAYNRMYKKNDIDAKLKDIIDDYYIKMI